MGLYRIKRHVIYRRCEEQHDEVWGIDRVAPGLNTSSAPPDTDRDDPLRKDECVILLRFTDRRFVTWDTLFEWLSEAESAGYELASGFQDLSPYSTVVLRGP